MAAECGVLGHTEILLPAEVEVQKEVNYYQLGVCIFVYF